ncbi:MAG: cytochrome P450 [Steroidobacteraceae bacterium]
MGLIRCAAQWMIPTQRMIRGSIPMSAGNLRIPPGPREGYRSSDDLLSWMQENFRQYGDIYRTSIYGDQVYVINSPQYLEHVLLRNWRNYLRKGQAVKRIALSLGNGLISSNGNTWVKQRRMIQPAFTRESVRALLDTFVKPNVALRDRWRQAAHDANRVDVTRDVSLTVLEVTLLAIFGDDYEKVAPHFALIAEESRNLEFAQTCNALGRLIREIAEERRSAGIEARDILGLMMRTRDRESGDPMSDADLARQGMTLVIAGHETTASVLNWIWYLLARHPQVEVRMQREIDDLLGDGLPEFDALGNFTYTRQVIEEALRTYPPLWLMTRRAIKPDQLGDYEVPTGTEIYISPYLLQRHPALWDDPDEFDPGRFGADEARDRHPLATCPFGAGPRNCIGEFFARIEMQIHLLLIARVLRLRHEPGPPADFVAGVNLLSRHHFIMRPELRQREPPAPG